MEDKVYWKCDYTYEEKGEVKTTEYKSPKQYDTSIKPNMMLKILAKEINYETSHTVINLIRLMETPAVRKEIKQVGKIKTKNPVSLAEIIYNVATTEEEIKEAEENKKNLEKLIVDMMYEYYKSKRDNKIED